jgi:hypothetical protein
VGHSARPVNAMKIVRQQFIGSFRIRIEAFDEYNDYSVTYRHRVAVYHTDGWERRWEVGRSERRAHEAFNRACTVIKHELGVERCAGLFR